jgi:phosphoglycerate dehydrogenase-like enzyme
VDSGIEQAALGGADVTLFRVDDASEVVDRLSDVQVLIVWHQIHLSRAVITRLQACRGIVCASVGTDNVDLDAARDCGISVSNVADYGVDEVADHTLALLLALSRNLHETIAAARGFTWRWQSIGDVRRLHGRCLGIVGLGRIGTAVAMRARSFGLRVVFFDPYLPPGVDKAMGLERADSLDQLLGSADVLSLHVPLTAETQGMIGRRELAQLPEGALVLNTSRGAVLEEEPLLEALEEGRIAGAGLDVVASEPNVTPRLVAHPRVLLTCHSAFYSVESLRELREKAARAAAALIADVDGEAAPPPDERVLSAVSAGVDASRGGEPHGGRRRHVGAGCAVAELAVAAALRDPHRRAVARAAPRCQRERRRGDRATPQRTALPGHSSLPQPDRADA